jgi:hypothetical protein
MLAVLFGITLAWVGLGATAPALADHAPAHDPVARVQLVIHRIQVLDTRDDGVVGDLVFEFQLRRLPGACRGAPCADDAPWITREYRVSADDGDVLQPNVVVGPNDGLALFNGDLVNYMIRGRRCPSCGYNLGGGGDGLAATYAGMRSVTFRDGRGIDSYAVEFEMRNLLSGAAPELEPDEPPAQPMPGRATISTNKDRYHVGEGIRICYTVPGPGPITIVRGLANGDTRVILQGYDDGSGGCVQGIVTAPAGLKRLRLDVFSGNQRIASDTTVITVVP